jgi:ribosomal protein S18 acetylase RimI-like enzyme
MGLSRESFLNGTRTAGAGELRVRPVEAADLGQVIAIDAEITGLEKTDYWYELFHRYGGGRTRQRLFLVAEAGDLIRGFIIGEIRDWEFGSAPCGWVFGLSVRPNARLGGVGTRMLEAVCDGFRHAGVRKVRTLLARDNSLVLSFFRSQGMMAAPFIPLEKDLD